MKKMKIYLDKNISLIMMFFYAVGIAGFIIPATQSVFFRLTPLTIIFSVLLLLYFHRPFNMKFVLLMSFIALAGFLVEVIGVQTGIVFGNYHYGTTLGFKIYDTPLLIGINWVMLTYCSYVLLARTDFNIIIKSILAAFLMTAYDIVLEPVAIKSDMWTWENSDVPFQNYMAWFMISLFFHLLLHLFKLKTDNKIASPLFKIQFVFFLVLSIVFAKTL